MKPGQIKEIAYMMMDERQSKEFEEELEMNLAYTISGVGGSSGLLCSGVFSDSIMAGIPLLLDTPFYSLETSL